ncbi:MAG: hypothetical protein WD844_10700 [Thermoleophilaceae bacterium]
MNDGVRVAFAGERNRFAPHVPADAAFVATDEHDPQRRLAEAGADAVVCLVTDGFPAGVVEGLRGTVLGWIPDAIPRPTPEDLPPDTEGALARVRGRDLSRYARVVACDPLAAEAVGAWRSAPLPVADHLFADVQAEGAAAVPLYLGGDVEGEREWILEYGRYGQELVSPGAHPPPELLERLLREAAIGVNVHAVPSELHEPTVALHLAAGHLLVSERLAPSRGLVPGLDYVEAANLEEVQLAVWAFQQWPPAYAATRRRGRLKAELFRASRVYSRVISDALRDVAAFG